VQRVVPSASDWAGPYAGLHLGAARDTSPASDAWNWFTNYPSGSLIGVGGGPLATTTTPVSFTTTFSNRYTHSAFGIIGGAQAGYNWQLGRVVVGFEGDWSKSTQHDTATYTTQPVASVFPPLPNFFFLPGTTQGWTSEEKINWISTLRGRVGLSSGSSLFT
jgi:hypothetical protein